MVDKTGTLTEGKPKLQKVITNERLGLSEDGLLGLVASLEKFSEHPLAEAIVAGAKERNVDLVKIEDFESVTGKGVFGTINGKKVVLGNEKMLKTENIEIQESELKSLNLLRSQGQTVMLAVVDGEFAGLIGVADSVKQSAKEAIDELHKQNIEVIMMTGDNSKTAEAVAKKLNIDQVFADVMPEQKAEKVKQLQAEGKVVAMAGDGVKDAPALAQA